ncbi:hypothetical protein [Fibrella forsythiae]|uniref:Uncharacterized protein n=1 Tax=Fibrella forsythiae TaxID=2817061 RepID=A0ABS3JDH0_9BACT|nr:hypothetical protein [Fibrella forsythiae]MBO0948041.1 hypothetical protein [Fibrella forsythiae]
MTTGNKLIIGCLAALGALQFVHILRSENPAAPMYKYKFVTGVIMIVVAIAGYNWAKRNPPQR